MILQRFEVPGLAHYSYLIASETQQLSPLALKRVFAVLMAALELRIGFSR